MASKGAYRKDDRWPLTCHHCKRKGHTKEKCFLLHPHLRPAQPNRPAWFKDEKKKAFAATREEENGSSSRSDYVTKTDLEEMRKASKSDLEEMMKSFSSFKESGNPIKPIIIDSGASHHMICDSQLIKNIRTANGNVIVANGDKIPVKGLGKLKLFDKTSQAFYMPDFSTNLLSVRKATNDLQCQAIFDPNKVCFQDIKTGKKLGEGVTRDGLYVLNNSWCDVLNNSWRESLFCNNAIWHARLGHPHSRALEILLPNVSYKHDECEACILGKHCKSVFPNSTTKFENCFDLVHSDVWTAPCITRDNHKYFVTFIDEKSKYTWLTLLPSKGHVFDAFTKFHNYVTNQFNAKIKVFRTDNGGEYMSNEFKNHLEKYGIIHQTSCPYTPQQNGVAERKNRHLMEVSRSMMFHTGVPRRYWGDAVMMATYLINRTPTKCLRDVSPYEVLNKTKPEVNHLRVFGCVCYVHIGEGQRDKLQPRSRKCIFIGYSSTQKGYKCFDPETNRTYVSREVKFVENQGYYHDKNWETIKDLSSGSNDKADTLRFILQQLNNPSLTKTTAVDTEQGRTHSSPTQAAANPEDNGEGEHESESKDAEDEGIPSDLDEVSSPPLRRSKRIMEISRPEQRPTEEPSSILRRSNRLKQKPSPVYYNNKAQAHPFQAVCSLSYVPQTHQTFLCKIDQDKLPKTYEEAKEVKEFADAVDVELDAMRKNQTWDVVPLPKGKKVVGSRWVFTIKRKSNGDIERHKARLVAKGFTQTYGIDYKETFAPVAKLHTVRVLLSVATNLSWELWQMDVKNAFLQGELEEEVYMSPPPRLRETIQPGYSLKLNKAIYGLKQSPRAWYHKLSSTLRGRGFKRSEADHSLFSFNTKEGIVVVLIYVDDIIISGNDKDGIQNTKALLKNAFDIKDLGKLTYFLGIEVCQMSDGLFLSQRKYTLDLLSESGKLGAKAANTPIEEHYKDERDTAPYEDIGRYQRLVGKLIYLTITRPDICFAVNQVSQHMKNPTVHNWGMVDRILRYLKGAPGKGIWMGKNHNTDIVGYCDADWAGDKIDRKSTTGYCTFVGGNLVTWRSKKQKVVSRSSAEAEYRAMANTTDEIIWLKALLKDLGVEISRPITMHCDNQAAIHIASNSVFHERTKHIEVDCHHIREKIEMGIILPTYTKSSDQLADIFTKATNSRICRFIHEKLGLLDLHTS